MQLIGEGQLAHHFWGDYSATVVIGFANEHVANQVAPLFPALWKQRGHLFGIHAGGSDLEAVERWLEQHGADMAKVGSLRYSIDYGEPFTITVDTADLTPDTSEQLAFNL